MLSAAAARRTHQARPWLFAGPTARSSATGWQQDSASSGIFPLGIASSEPSPSAPRARRVHRQHEPEPAEPPQQSHGQPSQKRRRPGSASQAHGCVHDTKAPSAATNLIAGGTAGMMEALVCHPLDTIKVRMQLSRRARAPGAKRRGFLATGAEIVRRETPLALYKGLGAVLTGIVPKMAIRFTSFEAYKKLLADKQTGAVSGRAIFMAGLAAGVSEAVAVVTPMEVIKIRLQAQYHSMADPLAIRKYKNAAHALYTVLREEGFGALYRGISLTALRQGTNQAVNFTAYTEFKRILHKWQPQYHDAPLPSWQTTIIGLVSGAMGPLSNAPIDTIKTRLQKMPGTPGESAWSRIVEITRGMFRQEGIHAFYKGITPRIMRVAPGQAVTFTVYEFIKEKLEDHPATLLGDKHEE